MEEILEAIEVAVGEEVVVVEDEVEMIIKAVEVVEEALEVEEIFLDLEVAAVEDLEEIVEEEVLQKILDKNDHSVVAEEEVAVEWENEKSLMNKLI